jgi:hypothetical protein
VSILFVSGCVTNPVRENAKSDFGPYPDNYKIIVEKYLAWHGGNRMLSASKPEKMELTVSKFIGGGVFYGWESRACYTPNTVTYIGERCKSLLINSGEVIEEYDFELKSLYVPRY